MLLFGYGNNVINYPSRENMKKQCAEVYKRDNELLSSTYSTFKHVC